MKNFIAVFDGYKMSESTLSYAVYLSKSSNAVLTGVFLDTFYYHNFSLKRVLKHESDPIEVIEFLEEKEQKERDLAVLRFQNACSEAGIQNIIHRDESLPLQELKYESMFADLMIINEHETFSFAAESSSVEFVDELLTLSHCPVLVVPDTFRPLENLIFLYDGSPSSTATIKLFSYLFSNMSTLPLTVLTVNKQNTKELYIPEELPIRALTRRLFSEVSFQILQGDHKDQLLKTISNQSASLVLLGASKLNLITGLFTDGLAETLLQNRDFPLFIAPKNIS